jgi:hypothetical protein
MVLAMVYNTQNYWISGLCPSSGILENTTFLKLDLFLSSGEWGRHLLCWDHWLRLALSKGPNRVGVSPPHLRTETNAISETLCFLVSRIPDDGRSIYKLHVLRYWAFCTLRPIHKARRTYVEAYPIARLSSRNRPVTNHGLFLTFSSFSMLQFWCWDLFLHQLLPANLLLFMLLAMEK